MWERWNSYTLERGFGDASMNSFNHYAYGAVAEWMFSRMAGILPDENEPGFKHFLLCPRPDTREGDRLPAGQERITFVRAHYDSIHGRIASGWEYKDGILRYEATVPEGTSATVELSVPDGVRTVRINGLDFTPGELGGKMEKGKLRFELGP